MSKYLMTQKWVEKLALELKLCELSRNACQQWYNKKIQGNRGRIVYGKNECNA